MRLTTKLSLVFLLIATLNAQTVPYWDMPLIDAGKRLSKSFNSEDYVLNPFHQPNEIYDQYTCHGGGDGNNDGVVDILDKNLADVGTDNFSLDVNGDGIVNTEDGDIIQEYIDGIITILPSWWNFIDKDEKLDWFTMMANIYTVDQKHYIEGDEDTRYISGNFATEICIRMQGYNENNTDMLGGVRKSIPDKYEEEFNGKTNIPVYFVNRIRYADSGAGHGHGMNALLVGDNPLDINDWIFYEPQSNKIQPGLEVGKDPGNGEFVKNDIDIYKFENFGGSIGWGEDMPSRVLGDPFKTMALISFGINNNGYASLNWNNSNLLLTKPTVAIENELSIPKRLYLKIIYPNPTNAQVNISFTLPHDDNVSIEVFDISGRLIHSLETGFNEQGEHNIMWNANNVPSGIYHIVLKNDSQVFDSKKVAILK